METVEDIFRHTSGMHYKIVSDDNNVLQAFMWQTSQQRNLYQAFGDVLQLDSTYKVQCTQCMSTAF